MDNCCFDRKSNKLLIEGMQYPEKEGVGVRSLESSKVKYIAKILGKSLGLERDDIAVVASG